MWKCLVLCRCVRRGDCWRCDRRVAQLRPDPPGRVVHRSLREETQVPSGESDRGQRDEVRLSRLLNVVSSHHHVGSHFLSFVTFNSLSVHQEERSAGPGSLWQRSRGNHSRQPPCWGGWGSLKKKTNKKKQLERRQSNGKSVMFRLQHASSSKGISGTELMFEDWSVFWIRRVSVFIIDRIFNTFFFSCDFLFLLKIGLNVDTMF